ncbi:winged helix-turn-helix domain-containing protein [Streptomyces sp. NPDC006527]|uniref:winged helix-turn-helix domain-containing protein n=1 Tax=Streptomyces sp. NPDC006527 TaxID=3364749 RepID=UPI00369AD221
MQAAEPIEQKIQSPDVVRRLRVSPKSASQWHQLWRDGGVRLWPAVARAGRDAVCHRVVWRELTGYLEQGAAAHGWVENKVWTAVRVAMLIGRKFHVSHSLSGATRPMHRLGFSPRAPREAGRRTQRAGRHRLQYRPDTLNGFMADTGLTLDDPASP